MTKEIPNHIRMVRIKDTLISHSKPKEARADDTAVSHDNSAYSLNTAVWD